MTDVDTRFDVVVVGGTPGGIAAALSAGRAGRKVLLIEPHGHVGGMSTSGLGKSDVEKRHLIGGLFREFTDRVRRRYLDRFGEPSPDFALCRDGYCFEPSVGEAVFNEMLAECSNISVLTRHRLVRAEVRHNVLVRIEIEDSSGTQAGSLRHFWCSASVFIDSTYEGDLLAAAGAEFRLGRESRAEFNEPHAGHIYFDYQTARILPGSTGEGDQLIPAYTYRLCLTTDPENAYVLTEPPRGYDRDNYVGYFDDLAAGRLSGPRVIKPGRGYNPAHFDTMVRALSVSAIPNQKTDVNINPRPLGFPFAEENAGYVNGDEVTRQQICERHRELTLGLLWFLQNDGDIPSAHRDTARQYHLPLDEFTDNGHFPFQLYVREARRLVGEYTLTEQDMTAKSDASSGHVDTIAVGEFPIDSFPCRKRQPGDSIVLEGYLGMLDSVTQPYEIPYRIMIPQSIDGLIVPVAASTTHVAYSSIRMEPTWMALGQAAGTAAHLALADRVQPRSVSVDSLRRKLLADGQVLGAESLNANAAAVATPRKSSVPRR